MSNRNYQYLDADLDPQKAAGHTLLVQVKADSFTFAVTDGKKLLLLSDDISLDELNGSAGDDDLLCRSYGRKIIGLPGHGFTLVPSAIFHPDKTADFARFLHVKAAEKVFYQSLDADNQVIFKVCGTLANKVAANFDLSDVIFAPAGWIKAIAGSNPPNESLYLHISGQQVDVLNFNDGRLHFYNTFEFMNEDELAYFVTVASNELQIPANAITLYMSGDIDSDDKNFNRLRKFFSSVELNSIKPLKLPNQFLSHPSLKLTALALCGSLAAH